MWPNHFCIDAIIEPTFAAGSIIDAKFAPGAVKKDSVDYSDLKEVLESLGQGVYPVQVAPGIYMYARYGQVELELPPNYEKRWQLPKYNRSIELPQMEIEAPMPKTKPLQVSWTLGVSIEPTEIAPPDMPIRK